MHGQVVEVLIPLRQPRIEHAGVGDLHGLIMIGRGQWCFFAKTENQLRAIATEHFRQRDARFKRIEQPAIGHPQL